MKMLLIKLMFLKVNKKAFKLYLLVFDLLRNLKDPEYPLTLEELNIISIENIHIKDQKIKVYIKPTIS